MSRKVTTIVDSEGKVWTGEDKGNTTDSLGRGFIAVCTLGLSEVSHGDHWDSHRKVEVNGKTHTGTVIESKDY